MGTYTASILIGKSHPNHGGITPTHEMYLSENDRPAWILLAHDNPSFKRQIWIPSVENMLEDGLLMISASILKDQRIRSSLGKFRNDLSGLEMYSIPESERLALHQHSRKAFDGISMKIILSVFDQSSISKQLSVLKEYPIEMEICKSIFNRSQNTWTRKTEMQGQL